METQTIDQLSTTDKKIIRDLVRAYPKGQRVRNLRAIFGHGTTAGHFYYLGEVVGRETRDNTQQVHKMKILMFLN